MATSNRMTQRIIRLLMVSWMGASTAYDPYPYNPIIHNMGNHGWRGHIGISDHLRRRGRRLGNRPSTPIAMQYLQSCRDRGWDFPARPR